MVGLVDKSVSTDVNSFGPETNKEEKDNQDSKINFRLTLVGKVDLMML